MHITSLENVKKIKPDMEGAEGVYKQVPISRDNGTPNFSFRVFTIEPGGHTPFHTHPFEHENFIMEGKGRVLIEGEWFEVGPGDVVFVPPDIQHTYENAGEEPFRFLCGIPVSKLRPKE